jgi:hypothetical protein
MSPQHPEELDRDDRLGAALSDLPVPDHGPTFWAELDHRLQGEHLVPNQTESATDVGPAETPLTKETVSLDEQRTRRATRRGGRLNRSLGAAAAAVALIVAVTGALIVIRKDDRGTDIRAADRPAGTANPGPTPSTTAPVATAPVPEEWAATYEGIEGFDGPDGCCSNYRLTLARDGSFRWTSTDGGADMAYDATTGRNVEVVSRGAGVSKEHPNYFVYSGVPAGGPEHGYAKPDPLGPISDFVVALARAGDPRITTATVAGRPAWHYDGPTVQDRLGGDGAPNHAIADVDQNSGVLLALTRSVGNQVVTRFTASDVTMYHQIDRSRYVIEVPPGAKKTPVAVGFVNKTLDEAAAAVPYDLLVPDQVPAGFTLESVQLDRDVPSSTGPEAMNPPAKQIVALTWRNGPSAFTVTLRPKGADQWDDPFGLEGMVPDAQPVRLELPGRQPLEGTVVVDAPLMPHLWGTTGDIVVTVSGDLSRTELERVAGSLQPHRG